LPEYLAVPLTALGLVEMAMDEGKKIIKKELEQMVAKVT
jgi:hypothetical protein